MTDINFMKSTFYLFYCLFLSVLISPSLLVNELTDSQYCVTKAQKIYDLEKTRYEDATLLVNEQKQQASAKASMAKAQAELDAENRQLKQIWNKAHL